MIVTGIILEVIAAAVGTTSKQLIAYSEHSGNQAYFHLGAFLNIAVGPLVDASAYAFAPQVVVAPFACLDVIFNALTAPYTLQWQKEKLTEAHIAATILVATGAVFTAALGSVHDESLSVFEIEQRLTKPASLVYFAVEVVLILGITLSLRWKMMSSTAKGIALGIAAGLLMGNVFCMKGFISIVRDTLVTGDLHAFRRVTPYVLLVGAVGGAILGHTFMRQGLGKYKGIFMVTIFEGAHICAACLSGCVVMEEMAHAPWWQYSLYWMSVWTIVAGMVLINTSAAESRLRRSGMARRSPSPKDGEKIPFAKDFAKQPGRYDAIDQDLSTPSEPECEPFSGEPRSIDSGEEGSDEGASTAESQDDVDAPRAAEFRTPEAAAAQRPEQQFEV